MGSESLKTLINMCQESYVHLYLGTLKTLSIFLQFGIGKLGVHWQLHFATLQMEILFFLQTSLAACMEMMVLLPYTKNYSISSR